MPSGQGTTARAEISVLGSTRIDGVALTGQQRTLVAVVALHRGGGASTDQLIDAIWFDAAPKAARQSLQNQIGRLRRRFGRGLITTDLTGYHLGPETDADIFVASITAVLDHPPEVDDAATIDGALALWAGTPYGDLDNHPLVEAERARLVELHAQAVERRAASRLLAGDDARAVLELLEATNADPYRETGWLLLMQALRVGGREGEALTAFDRAARHVAELGATPSEPLRAERRAILAGQTEPMPPAGPSHRACRQRRDPHQRRWCVPATG